MAKKTLVKFIVGTLAVIYLLLPVQVLLIHSKTGPQIAVEPKNVALAKDPCDNGKPPDIDVGGSKKCIEELTPEEKAKYTTSQEKEACRAEGHGLTWLICSLINVMQSTIEKLENFIIGMLFTKPLNLNFTNGQPPTTTSDANQVISVFWNNVRNISNIFLVVIFLIMIIGNAASFGVDSYTVKRTLPRLVMAAILIQFSFLICSIAVDITNILGVGIIQFMWSVIGGVNFQQNLSFGAGTVVGIGAAVGAVALVSSVSSGGALLILLGAVIAVLGTLITLALRQVLITVLIVLSPLAFLAWVLPNTENLFKTWGKNFLKTLLMFPLIALIFGASRFGALLAFSSGEGPQQVVGILLMIAPLFAVPFTFKWAGGALAFGAGAISGYAAGKGKQAKESEAAKGVIARRRERAAMQSQNQEAGMATRAFGRLGSTGGWSNTVGMVGRGGRQTNRRRIRENYQASLKAQQDRVRQQLDFEDNALQGVNVGGLGNQAFRATASRAQIEAGFRAQGLSRVRASRLADSYIATREAAQQTAYLAGDNDWAQAAPASGRDLFLHETAQVAKGYGSQLLGVQEGEDVINQTTAINALSSQGEWATLRNEVTSNAAQVDTATGNVVTDAAGNAVYRNRTQGRNATVSQTIVRQGLGDTFGTAQEKAPDVALGNVHPAFDNARGDKVSAMHHSSVGAMVDYYQNGDPLDPAHGGGGAGSAVEANLYDVVHQYHTDATYRSKLSDTRTRNHLQRFVNNWNLTHPPGDPQHLDDL